MFTRMSLPLGATPEEVEDFDNHFEHIKEKAVRTLAKHFESQGHSKEDAKEASNGLLFDIMSRGVHKAFQDLDKLFSK